ncbi:heavy metal-binding domain-containing protein [Hymenobacter norwichensis]|uniref:heavy metal-binding domain-containing protein n=1 Tax=Hymenobacter norwichensis TaxID=223903 RepID=UPI0012F9566F|nr:heavy metal-binding domain-containing protein [Hymenobacter norwichensis]
MKFSSLLLAAALLAAPFSLAAQHQHGAKSGAAHGHQAAGENHAHNSPHGGIVRTAGAYHLELVQQAGALHIYLLDAKEATVAPTGTAGTVMLLTSTGKSSTATLTPSGDHLVATLPAGTTLRTAIVSVKAKGQSLSARFEKLDASKVKPAKAVGAAYNCSMQCEGSASDKPGSCPKCGMALVKNT